MKTRKLVSLIASTVVLSCAGAWASPAELLEKGIYTEETKGEIAAAAEIYRQVVTEAGADRALAAQAQLRLGLCELKLGNKPRAISELEQLKEEFPDKAKLMTILEEHMPSLLDEILKQIEQNYIQTVDRGELMETALRAIVGKIDANSSFLRENDIAFISARELAQINEGMQQKIAGIGAALKVDDQTGQIVVSTLLPGSPALKAGLRAGDRIIEVDGAALPTNQGLELGLKLLRGTAGTPVTATVQRGQTGEVLTIRMVRDSVRLPSVKGDRHRPDGTSEFMLDPVKKIGYIRLIQVGQETASEMTQALTDLKGHGMQGLVLDLRNNPGGLLNEAITVSDLFLDGGRILTVKGKTEEQVFDAKADRDFLGFPLAVIVNRNSASAAEIIAAALQDHRRATVVGERTYGQALVKAMLPLKDSIGVLKLPIAAYFRPSGNNMNRYPNAKVSDIWGVTPNTGYEVSFSEAELAAYERDRHARDVIGGEPDDEQGFDDRQMAKAVEYVQSQLTQPQ